MRGEFNSIAAGFALLPGLSGNGDLPVFVNSGASALTSVTAVSARSKLGLGTMATQNANNVAITGGSITGVTPLSSNNAQLTGGAISGITATSMLEVGTNNAQITGGNISNNTVVAHTILNNSLTSNIALSNTSVFFDGPSLNLGSGTWFVSSSITVKSGNSGNIADVCEAKLWDGNNVIQSTHTNIPSGSGQSMPTVLFGFISNPTGNVRMSIRDDSTTTGNMVFNLSGAGQDSTITAFRIG